MIDLRSVTVLAERELRDAWRNRWFLLFTATFAAIALALSWLGSTGVAGARYTGFARTAASLVNLVLLVVPLMGLALGANAVAGERERGSLLVLLAQPIEPRELVLGKFAGLGLALLASVMLGFGGAGLMLAARGAAGPPGVFAGLLALTVLLGLGAVAVGLLVSTVAPRSAMAVGLCVFLWLVLVFAGDLGLMGTAVALRLEADTVLALGLANPLQVFKLAVLTGVRNGLEVLGPAGLLATRTFGGGLRPLLVGILVLWTLVPLGAAVAMLERRRLPL